MTVSTLSNGTRHFRRSPSSIISSDSDIRFTRKKLSSQYRCGCCIIACFLLLLLLAAGAVYVGYTFFASQLLEDEVFRGNFKVIEGDSFLPELADPSTEKFKYRSRDYRERLNLLFKRSPIRYGFVGTEILALDGNEGKDLVVHFDIRVNPNYINVNAEDLQRIIASELSSEESRFFKNLTIDEDSLEVKPQNLIPQPSTTKLPTTIVSQAVTQTPSVPRKCFPLDIQYCSNLPYNITTYPNILEHKNSEDVNKDVISFREVVDSECYHHAYDFVCRIIQPRCSKNNDEIQMVLPCRTFCRDFMLSCGNRLSTKFKRLLDCNRFPEFGEGSECVTKPGCVKELQAHALSPRVCDGVIDCQNLSDETSCSYCPENSIHCGIGRSCIPVDKRCDGKQDCPDGSDEKFCLNLAHSVKKARKIDKISSHLTRYTPGGFVIFNEKGEIGKLCTENLNTTLKPNETASVLETVAASLCNTLLYKNVKDVKIVKDTEDFVPYVRMKDPTASEISFIRSQCSSKEVLHVACDQIECGLPNTRNNFYQGLPKMAGYGDWPWHVALFKDEVHICDGTLVSSDWVVTTTSCFQGQSKAEWRARLGTIRLSSSTPWEQERTIVGMVKSPVEGSTLAMIKLDTPVSFNDFIRPICLPDKSAVEEKMIQCNTLGWARNREQLQRVQIKVSIMEKCENISISTVNSLCTEDFFGQDDCNEEEFAGSPMVCLSHDSMRWSLIGVTNWRIACSKSGVQRPRMYDKISSNVDWIVETISAIS